MRIRHFLSLLDLSPEELHGLISRAIELKQMRKAGDSSQPLRSKTLAMVFQLSSTRTRVAFEAGMQQLGGHAIFLSPDDTQLGRGEPIGDTAKVLSELVDLIMVRVASHDDLETFAAAATVPVINAMTSRYHPCQLLADIQTFVELRGTIQGRRVAFVGDGYNMCNSYINAARQFGFQLNVACPKGFEPDRALLASCNNVRLADSPEEAVSGVDLVVTDVWSSMGHERERQERCRKFAPYQITRKLLDRAAEDVLFMHCLPARRGEEVSHDLLEDPRSVVFAEAGNRLHSQKALLEFLATSHRRGH
jgi:ornithine carbamoyltransferase